MFGFGAFAFLVFTMFDAYRTAEAKARVRLESGAAGAKELEPPSQDKTVAAWGVFLMILGVLFLLQNIIPYYFLHRLWPLVFIFLGAYLVYRAVREKDDGSRDVPGGFPEKKDLLQEEGKQS